VLRFLDRERERLSKTIKKIVGLDIGQDSDGELLDVISDFNY
jgi:hypothetical protein